MNVVREYDTKLDSKNRCVLRAPSFQNYHVKEFANGEVHLEPRVLVHPDSVSKKSLKMMDATVKNFMAGKAGRKVDLNKLLEAD